MHPCLPRTQVTHLLLLTIPSKLSAMCKLYLHASCTSCSAPVQQVVFQASELVLISGAEDGEIRTWDLVRQTCLATMPVSLGGMQKSIQWLVQQRSNQPKNCFAGAHCCCYIPLHPCQWVDAAVSQQGQDGCILGLANLRPAEAHPSLFTHGRQGPLFEQSMPGYG